MAWDCSDLALSEILFGDVIRLSSLPLLPLEVRDTRTKNLKVAIRLEEG